MEQLMKQMETIKSDGGMRWEMYDFSDLVNDITGGNRKFQSFEYQANAAFPIVDQLEKFISGFTNENAIVKRKKDVVIFGDHTKALKFIDFDFCLGADGVKVLGPVEELDSKFLFYFLNTITLPDVGYSRHFKFLKEISIPLPPLPIQKRIAEILDAADALKRKDQELLKKYDELAQAIFIDMFGDPVKNEKGWEVKRLDELLLKGEKISYGVVQPGDDFPNGVPIVRVGDFKLMKIDKTNLKRINPEIEKTYNRTRLKGDEILIACVGSVGKIALADESLKGFNIVRATAKVRVDGNIINRTYLAFHLSQKSIQNYFIAETRTSSQPTLNIKQIEETKILVPPIRIQNQFNLLSTDLLKQIEMVNDSNSVGLFQTLIQKAFKGELVA